MKIVLTHRPSWLCALILCLAANLFVAPTFFHGVTAHAADEEWDRHVRERLDSPERQAFIEGAAERDAQVMEQRRAERAAEEKRKEQSEQQEQQRPENEELTVELNDSKPEGYSLEADSRPRPDTTTDVTVTVKKNGRTVGKGVVVRFEADPAYPNLSNRVRHTDAAGQIALKGLIRRADAGQLKALVDGQKIVVSVPAATDAAVQATAVTVPAPEPDGQSETNDMADAGQAPAYDVYSITARGKIMAGVGHDVLFVITKNDRPAADVTIRFEQDPAYANLPAGYLRTDAQGHVEVKKLTASPGAGDLRVEVAGQEPVTCRMTVSE